MAIYEKRGVIAGRVEDVFHQPPEEEQELLCTYLDESDSIAVHSNMLTIVLNRDIRKSVEISAAMAVHLAKKYPSRNILLLNTYAGTELMQQSLARGLAESGYDIPASYAPLLGRDYQDKIVEGAQLSFPENLRILSCETGTLETWRIEEEMNIFGCDVAILNSIEYSMLEEKDRRHLACSLLELRRATGLTLVLFSHEMRADVASYTPARGPIGLMSAHAGSVWRIMTQFDRARYNTFYKRIASATRGEWKSNVSKAELQAIEEEKREEKREMKRPYTDYSGGSPA